MRKGIGMRLREIVRWTLSRWLAVGAGVVIAALVVGFAFGIFDSGGALAQAPAPTPTPTVPPFSTPTSAEINAMLAANPNLPTVPIVVIDPKTGLPAEDPPRTARQRAAPTAAEAEYLASDPERAIYLEGIDRVIHLVVPAEHLCVKVPHTSRLLAETVSDRQVGHC